MRTIVVLALLWMPGLALAGDGEVQGAGDSAKFGAAPHFLFSADSSTVEATKFDSHEPPLVIMCDKYQSGYGAFQVLDKNGHILFEIRCP